MVRAMLGNRVRKRRILYYPTINIPSGQWLRQAILYWDEIASIVPKDSQGHILLNLSPDVQFLKDEGEFKPVKPEDLVFNPDNSEAFGHFRQEFLNIISDPYFRIFL